jgi:hypothetical protein
MKRLKDEFGIIGMTPYEVAAEFFIKIWLEIVERD